jgi:hypothetical protein
MRPIGSTRSRVRREFLAATTTVLDVVLPLFGVLRMSRAATTTDLAQSEPVFTTSAVPALYATSYRTRRYRDAALLSDLDRKYQTRSPTASGFRSSGQPWEISGSEAAHAVRASNLTFRVRRCPKRRSDSAPY